MKKIVLCAILILLAISAIANVRLPAILGSNMVLQQQSAVKFWGWSDPAEKILITTSWNNKTDSVEATRDANWQITIQTPVAGGPYIITIKGNNEIVLSNVLIGEVWLCSGQSNMEMNANWGLADVKAELPTGYNNQLRFFYVPKTTADFPVYDVVGEWKICDSTTLKTFSAVGYFFGKKINAQMKLPVGLINSNWGGTAAEVWTPAALVTQDAALKSAAEKLVPAKWWPFRPGVVFNAMISPLIDFPIAGTIWYQGESNTVAPATYTKLFTMMIDSWRNAWKKNFPFYYVQIAPYKYGNDQKGALLQEAQAKAISHPNVGMVVTTDLVADTNDIHPVNKHDVGDRLANWALANTYHQPGFEYRHPAFRTMNIQKERALITFDEGVELIVKGNITRHLQIAGADKIFYPAEATLEKNILTVWSRKVKQPVAVRYSFGNTAMGNLFSKAGLPVVPFRTDDWEK